MRLELAVLQALLSWTQFHCFYRTIVLWALLNGSSCQHHDQLIYHVRMACCLDFTSASAPSNKAGQVTYSDCLDDPDRSANEAAIKRHLDSANPSLR